MFWKKVPALAAPRVPKGKTVKLPKMPDWAPEIDMGAGPIVPFHQGFFLEYGDAYGDVTNRRITTRSLRVWGNDDLALWAWCHEREAPRTFLAKRVIALTDAETGECYEPPKDWLWSQYRELPDAEEYFDDHVAARHRAQEQLQAERDARVAARQAKAEEREQLAQQKRQAAELLKLARIGVLCLVYVAKADGRMDADERAVIAQFVREFERERGTSLRWVDVHARLRKLVCDQEEFLTCMKQLRDAPADIRLALLATANRLMMIDGTAHEGEQRAVGWLKVMLAR